MQNNFHRFRYSIFAFTFVLLSFFSIGQTPAQQQYTNIPTLHLTTDNLTPITSKINWLPGDIIIKSTDPTEELSMRMEIRGRGNSTWNMPKKPYRFRLVNKTNVLNLPARERNWVLLANYADKTLIRNAVAMKISQIVGLEFTPSVRFVDVVLNNQFLGNYMLTDQVEVAPYRVYIPELSSTDTQLPRLSGGYLLEFDGFASSEPVWFTTPKGLKVTIKSPDSEDIQSVQQQYIYNFIADIENTLFSPNFADPVTGYRSKMDTTTLINWYIASELSGNSDAFWSTYVYKKRSDDKLYFGPMWDYDIAFNNDDRLGDATEKRMSTSAHNPRVWIQQLLTDEWFQAAVWRRWQQLVAGGIKNQLLAYVDATAAGIQSSQQLNFQRWNNLNTKVYREYRLFPTYAQGVDYLKSYISARVDFLNSSFAYVEPEKPSEPFNPGNFYYMIMNVRTNNVVIVPNGSTALNHSLVLWQPRSEDATQLWEMKPVDGEWFHIVNKYSGLVMTGNGRGTNLIQTAASPSDFTQQWKMVPVLTGNIYGVVNRKSNYSINNSGGNFANGTAVIEWDNNIAGSQNQQWYLLPMEGLVSTRNNMPLIEVTSRLELYPNPATDRVIVTVSTTGVAMLEMINIAGQPVYQQIIVGNDLQEQRKTIDVSHLQPGVYFIVLKQTSGERISRRIIVQ